MEDTIDSRRISPLPRDATERLRRERSGRALRNRILLYLGGFEMAGIASLELAAECFRRIAPDPDPAEAMLVLNELLRERGLAVPQSSFPPLIYSFPPLNRKAMVSGGMESFTLYGSAKRMIRSVFRVGSARRKP